MSSITILPESDETTLCLRLTGVVTASDHDRFLHQEIKRRAEVNGFFNMMIHYDQDFKGWAEDAADLSFKSVIALGAKARRLAYVNPNENRIMLMKLTQPIVSAEVRYFETSELEQAIAWVKG